jgi:hypothetical protein
MLTPASSHCKCGGKEIPELSPSSALLLAVLHRGPREWEELSAMGFEPLDLVSGLAELIFCAQISILAGPRGVRLERGWWPNGGRTNGPTKAA